MMDPPCDPATLRNLDYVLSTHGHTDHMDRGTLGIVYDTDGHTPLFVCPRAEVEKAVDRGVPYERMVAMDAGESWSSIGGDGENLHIIAIASAHEELAVDSHGNHLFLGYVIEIDGIRLYHSGDCVPYEGLVEQLLKLDIDIAFLPVNGRDTFRAEHGVPGNFTLEEALELVGKASIPYLVPHHFGLFEFNTIDPVEIRRRIPDNGPMVVIPELSTGFRFFQEVMCDAH
jgi:L-ascorbate metabolism protein UlaG (beta-lactamase superfamily)